VLKDDVCMLGVGRLEEAEAILGFIVIPFKGLLEGMTGATN
jgi:hypothetical protein